MKYLFDGLSGAGSLRTLGIVAAGLLMLEIGRAVLGGWLSVLSWDVRLAVEYGVREQIVAKLNALPVSYHQSQTVGGTTNRVNQAITGFVAAFADLAFNLLPTLAYLALALAAMARLEWRLSLLVFVFTPLPALIGVRAAAEQTQRERRLVERWSSIYSRFNEVLAGMVTVKGFAMEDAEQRRFLDGVRDGNDLMRRGVRADTRTGGLRGFAGTLARLSALTLGGVLVMRGEITIGTLVAFLGYITGLFGPVQGLTNTYQTFRRATVSLETIFDILDAEDVVADAPGARDVAPLVGAVNFRNVSFDYGNGASVLRDISLDVAPGETIALVGPSGSGKTTLTMLLQRLYVVTSGSISVDGVDIATMTQRSLRAQLGVVFQDPHLFNDTVHANIAYGRPEASRAEVEAVARAAHAHDFIQQLSEGYDTLLGERASRLSGGQRQRIAIARALLKSPPILILDEASSALDAESEELVQRALGTLLRGRTAFVIAHRLSTIMHADRIVVVKDGELTEMGTHATLMQEGGYYASLVQRQAKGFLGAPGGVRPAGAPTLRGQETAAHR